MLVEAASEAKREHKLQCEFNPERHRASERSERVEVESRDLIERINK